MQGHAEDFVAAIPLPAVLIRRDERIAALNAEAIQLIGDGLLGRHFITALRQPLLMDAVEGCLRDRQPRQTEYLTSSSGQETSFRASVRPVELETGGGALVTLEDVTHVAQIGQMRRDFVANVSHELRTPLTALIGFIETLQGPAQGDVAASARFLGIMQTEALRMNRLVGDLLSLSRVEAEERVRPTERLDAAALIRSCVHGFATMARDNKVRLEAEVPDMPVLIVGDPDQLRQVVNNLIENAIKYAGTGQLATVSLTEIPYEPRVRGRGVTITVRDTGPGIDTIHVPRLTERFYRIDNHRSREMGGTGLGLAIVKHIVNRHRGRLRIDSTKGEGSTFSVVLPSD